MKPPDVELGSITKQVRIAAPPDVVYQVISRPEHIAGWWSDDAEFEPEPGRAGTLVWRATSENGRHEDYVVWLTVLEAVPGERFSFRWVYPDGEQPDATNSMLVTFTLRPDGTGTLLTVTEDGMREHGWEAAVLEDYYASHDDGWSRHLADLVGYVADLAAEGGPRT
jgi:uncharacterized protein YndB with AHSA1/START domain